nr:MAG TPA: hypothetical protein [Caudoviricetes sp.]
MFVAASGYSYRGLDGVPALRQTSSQRQSQCRSYSTIN